MKRQLYHESFIEIYSSGKHTNADLARIFLDSELGETIVPRDDDPCAMTDSDVAVLFALVRAASAWSAIYRILQFVGEERFPWLKPTNAGSPSNA